MDSRHYNNEKLKRAREAAGLTQEQVAELLNVHKETISRADRGTVASYELLVQICAICKIGIKDILYDSPELATAA